VECPITSRISSADRESYLLTTRILAIRFVSLRFDAQDEARSSTGFRKHISFHNWHCPELPAVVVVVAALAAQTFHVQASHSSGHLSLLFGRVSHLSSSEETRDFSSGPLPWQCLCCCVVSLLICAASSPHLDMRYANALATLYDCRSKRYTGRKFGTISDLYILLSLKCDLAMLSTGFLFRILMYILFPFEKTF